MLNDIISLGISKREAEELIRVSKDIDKDYALLKEGFPIQYLIGYVNFYGNKITVNKNVLIPRYETELLVEKTLIYINEMFDKPKILDIGTGSGAIAISIRKNINCEMYASDISKEALEVAKENSTINETEINLINSDIFSNISEKYDVIISNPPYISRDEEIMECVRKHEPNIALYAEDDGIEFYRNILKESKEYLKNKFLISFEIGCTQAARISNIAHDIYPDAKILVEKDYSQKDRYIFIKNL